MHIAQVTHIFFSPVCIFMIILFLLYCHNKWLIKMKAIASIGIFSAFPFKYYTRPKKTCSICKCKFKMNVWLFSSRIKTFLMCFTIIPSDIERKPGQRNPKRYYRIYVETANVVVILNLQQQQQKHLLFKIISIAERERKKSTGT